MTANPYRRMMTASATIHLPTGDVIAPACVTVADPAGDIGASAGTVITVVTPARFIGSRVIPAGTRMEVRNCADRTRPMRHLTVVSAADLPPNVHIQAVDQATPPADF